MGGWNVPALGAGATESPEGGGGAEGGELFGVGVTMSFSPRSSLVYPACTLHGPVWLGTASGYLRILTLLLGTLSLQIRGIWLGTDSADSDIDSADSDADSVG